MTDDRLNDAYDPDDMAGEDVYPGGWDDRSNLEWLLAAAGEVRAFYKDAAKGNGMLQFLA